MAVSVADRYGNKDQYIRLLVLVGRPREPSYVKLVRRNLVKYVPSRDGHSRLGPLLSFLLNPKTFTKQV